MIGAAPTSLLLAEFVEGRLKLFAGDAVHIERIYEDLTDIAARVHIDIEQLAVISTHLRLCCDGVGYRCLQEGVVAGLTTQIGNHLKT